jgi:hypothetical protein
MVQEKPITFCPKAMRSRSRIITGANNRVVFGDHTPVACQFGIIIHGCILDFYVPLLAINTQNVLLCMKHYISLN